MKKFLWRIYGLINYETQAYEIRSNKGKQIWKTKNNYWNPIKETELAWLSANQKKIMFETGLPGEDRHTTQSL